MTKVIYHKADFDGIFCREIARKFLIGAELIGWDYGDPTPEVSSNDNLYILDLSVPDLMNHPELIWIDHHKSAMEKYPSSIPGYRIDGVAACRLTWQWFLGRDFDLPVKDSYVERFVKEPLAVRLAGEYDIWDRRDSDAELFQHGLRSESIDWQKLLVNDGYVADLLLNGQAIQYAKTKENESIIKAAGFTTKLEGLTFLAVNHARYNSHLFTAGLTPEHDACLGFAWRDGHWNISLYHAPGKEHHDLSLIAIKYGGGGHKGACGFRVKELNIFPI